MSCGRNCNQGRACTCMRSQTELANDVPLDPTRTFGGRLRRGQVIPIQPSVTGGPIPLRRRARRFLRALWEFLTAPCFKP